MISLQRRGRAYTPRRIGTHARIVILGIPNASTADETERQLPDVAAARRLIGSHSLLDVLLAERRKSWASRIETDPALFARTADAVRLAHARLALRHGRFGADFHPYHNEGHVLDICGERLERVLAAPGQDPLGLREACLLMLFGAGHDLRQREAPHFYAGVGANERASSAEMARILDLTGFSREADADLFLALELAIAGSTFDARPPPGGGAAPSYNAAEQAQGGGALAARLDVALDAHHPGWRDDAVFVRAHQLALVAADLDTASVAEPFARFATTAENLCREREMLAGRPLDSADSALPALRFLTDGQERFFFDLHRFVSARGRAAFGAAKDANAPRLAALCARLRARFEREGPPATGQAVIDASREERAFEPA